MKALKWLKRILLAILGLIAMVILIGFTYEHAARYIVKRQIPVKGELIDVGGHRLNINIKGEGGPLVVFESGFDNVGSLVWNPVQEEISKFNITASYDRAGILFSERGRNPKTAENMADELHTLLKKAGQKGPYILVGHSAAGLTLRLFVAKYPDEVLGVILVDASHPDQFSRMQKVFESMPMKQSPKWVEKFACETGIVRFQVRNLTFFDSSLGDSLNIITRKLFPKSYPIVSEETGNAMAIRDEVENITSFGDIPLIVITGTGESRRASFPNDEIAQQFEEIWMELQNDLLTLSTNSEHILADKSGHYVQLDQPEVVVNAIEKLLKVSDNDQEESVSES